MINFKKTSLPPVTSFEMESIYEKLKTPVKIGAAVKWDDFFTDSPTVFQQDGIFYMYFIAISKNSEVSGYETHLAKSEDLIHWDYVGPILKRNDENRWDSKQCAGYGAFIDIDYDGTYSPQKVNDSFYISYLAGNSDGYEPDPLLMGLAKGSDPTDPDSFTRLNDPILRPDDGDSRPFETATLYKSNMFIDSKRTTGYPYVMAYNAKEEISGKERMFLAVSNDGEHWERYGDRAVIDLVSGDPKGYITGDPQVILIDDIYVMLFFRYQGDKGAYDTFACSRDLEHWTVWEGEPLIKSEYEWENVFAHKPYFIRHNGKNYHFYCAVNDKNERFIAVAVNF